MTPMIEQWVVYEKPRDYPDSFVARQWLIDKDGPRFGGAVLVSDSLESIRRALSAAGLTCLARDPNDDPVIVEVWL